MAAKLKWIKCKMMNRILKSKPKNIACYSHLPSFTKFPILTPNLKISLTIKFTKNRLRMIRGSEQTTTTTTNTNNYKKKKKTRSWIKPIHRFTQRISSIIYSSFGFGLKKSSSHNDEGEEREERENDESLEYLMYKLSIALDGTTSSRYIPLMEMLKQMQGGGGCGGAGAGGLVRERKGGRRSFHVFSRKRRRRNWAKTIGKRKKITEEKEKVEEEEREDEEWGNGEELCKRRILMGWRCRPIKEEDDDDNDDGVFLPNY